MMTKRFMIAAVLLIAVLGIVSVVSAQTPVTPTPGEGAGQGWTGRGRGGMMGGWSMMGSAAGTGAMHDYMEPILAAKLGMTEEELEQAYADGKTFWLIAEEKDLTSEEALQMMTDARSEALDAMVKDNVITQEQADLMKTHMSGRGGGMGFGGGCMGGQFSGGAAGTPRGGRW
jgi:hypothetical protein